MVTIRTANNDEVQDLQNLNDEVFIDNQKYDPDLEMGWAQSEKGKEYFTKLLDNPHACCLIAEENGKKLGYIAASPKNVSYRKSRYLEINDMGVIPGYRSRGIGTMLMEACFAWAKSHGFQKAFVAAYYANGMAVKFYKRNGFSEIDISLEREI